jgi:hypothetical protein
VSLVLDLRIDHDRVGSSTDPTLNGQLRYPNNLDQSLNDATADSGMFQVCYALLRHAVSGMLQVCCFRYASGMLCSIQARCVRYASGMLLQGGYIVKLSDFHSYRLIGKLTAFLHLQELRLCNPPVDYSTSTVRLSLNISKSGLS